MRKTKLFINMIFILTLVMTTVGNTTMVAQAGDNKDELKADPRLLQMAEENPDAIFMVIVQKEAPAEPLSLGDRVDPGAVATQVPAVHGQSPPGPQRRPFSISHPRRPSR